MLSIELFNNGQFSIEERINPHTRKRELVVMFNDEFGVDMDRLKECMVAFKAAENSEGSHLNSAVNVLKVTRSSDHCPVILRRRD